jgi:D-tagatose-1,6-bisphosphate aldolase subunit GatZ/KbaZ
LAQLGFAFQKVGPALTYAYRAALYQLDALRDRPALKQVMEALMTANPQYWQGYYHGDAGRLARLRHDGLADRIRYYWAMPQAQAAVAELLADVDSMPTHQVMTNPIPDAVLDRAETLTGSPARRIVYAYIQLALDPYFFREHS